MIWGSRGTWQEFLGGPTIRAKASGMHEETTRGCVLDPASEYHGGKPMTESERRACRGQPPKSMGDGSFLFWDFRHVEVTAVNFRNARWSVCGVSSTCADCAL